MNSYRYTISLRIRHPSIDPAEVTRELGLEPQRSWRKGLPRETPRGAPLEGFWKDSYWTSGNIARGQWPGESLSQSMGAMLDKWVTHKPFFERIRRESGRVEFFVGLYIEGNTGDVIDAELMASMGALNIDLSLDIYPPDQPQNDI